MPDNILPENDPSKKVDPIPEAVLEVTSAEEAPTSVLPNVTTPVSEESSPKAEPVAASPVAPPAHVEAKASSTGSYFRGNKLFTALLAFLAGFLIFASGILMGLAIGATHENGGQGMHGGKGIIKQYIPENQGPMDNNEMAPRTDRNQPQDGTQVPPCQQDNNETIIPVPEVTN